MLTTRAHCCLHTLIATEGANPKSAPAGCLSCWLSCGRQVAYPFMHLAFQLGDFNSLLQGRTVGAELLGASTLGEHDGADINVAVACDASACQATGAALKGAWCMGQGFGLLLSASMGAAVNSNIAVQVSCTRCVLRMS